MRWDFRNKKLVQRAQSGQRGPTFRNPLFQKRSLQGMLAQDLGTALLAAATLVLAGAYFFLYSPIFQLNHVVIEGTSTVPSSTLERITQEQLRHRRSGIFLQSNYFTFSGRSLKTRLNEQYSFSEITIRRKPFHSLSLRVEEKLPFALLVTQSATFIIDESGLVIRQPDEGETLQASFIRIVEEVSLTAPSVGERVLSDSVASFVKSTSENFSRDFGMVLNEWRIPSLDAARIHARTEKGWEIYFSTEKDLAQQYANARNVWNDSLKSSPPDSYIDVRILDRVYYK